MLTLNAAKYSLYYTIPIKIRGLPILERSLGFTGSPHNRTKLGVYGVSPYNIALFQMPPKVVVFDLDETLGYFSQLGQFWDILSSYLKSKNIPLTQQEFIELLNLFPEFLRPNIFSILNYLKHKKERKHCQGVMLYTNNQAPRSWATFIVEYLNNKITYRLFDQVISAFKVNGKRIEMCRTTNEKTVGDFIKCTKLPINTEICFLDDVYHPEMIGDNVYYIKVNPYVYNLPFDEMVERFVRSDLAKDLLGQEKNTHDFQSFVKVYLETSHFFYIEKTKEEYEIDKIVSKKTMILLQDFFKKSWNETTQKVRHRVKGKRGVTKRKSDNNL